MDLKATFYNIVNKLSKRKSIDTDYNHKRLLTTSIADYRAALQQTKNINPTFHYLISTYDEVMRDTEVSSAIELVKNNILSRKFTIYRGEFEDETTSELLQNSAWFEQTLNIIIESIYYGYSVLAIDKIDDDVLAVCDYDRELYNPVNRKLLKNKYSSESGYDIDSQAYKNWYIDIVADQKYEGELSKIAIYQILLKNVMQSWSSLLERFGSPQVVAKTSNNDDLYLNELSEYLSQIQTGSFSILDSETDIEFVEAQSLNADTFEKLLLFLQSQIRKQILGSESLGNEKSFVGSAELSYKILHNKVIRVIKFIEQTLNEKVFPALAYIGLDQYSDLFIEFDKDFEKDETVQIDAVTKLLNAGVPVDFEWIGEEFGIKINIDQNVDKSKETK